MNDLTQTERVLAFAEDRQRRREDRNGARWLIVLILMSAGIMLGGAVALFR